MYLLIKRGVYRHDILGFWASLDVAKLEAFDAVLAESDHYHSVEIFELTPNTEGEKLVGQVVYNHDTKQVDFKC